MQPGFLTLLDPTRPSFTDVPRGAPFYNYIETARAQTLIAGYADGTFRPNNSVTRGQLSKMLYLATSGP